MTDRSRIWVLADPRAGTAAQALGIAERLGRPFEVMPLQWGELARVPWPWPSLAGLEAEARRGLRAPWPALVVSAGRRSAPVSRWLRRRGARTVHAMCPGFGMPGFDLLVIGRHDGPRESDAVFPILGAAHRMSQQRLAAAKAEWGAQLAALPAPRVALLLGGAVRSEGMDPELVAGLARDAAGFGGSVMATTSRRTGPGAMPALRAALGGTPHRLHDWSDPGPNPFAGFLAWADAVVVTGDSVSMISEALATAAPVFIAETTEASRHRRLWRSLYEAGQARPFVGASLFGRTPLDESERVAREILARGWA